MKQRYNICHRKLCLIIASLLIATCTWAQTTTVSGIVTDTQGEALLGVTVSVEGTTKGTISNIDGAYSLEITSSAKNIKFSFIGMETVILPIGDKKVISPQMTSTSIGMDELVVVGYGTQKKVTITGAVSSMNTDEILASPNASPTNALAGKITGLTSIQSSGQPGADEAQLFVRGVGTLEQGNASPLIMVDGVERSFSQLDANEIADITVLKDASATAVYGIRGANGVILVTTRRGEKGKARIGVSTSFGLQTPIRLPEFTDSYTYASTHRNAQLMDGVLPNKTAFSEDQIEAFRTNSDPILYPSTDWMDYVMKDYSAMNKTNVNISGGTDKVKYFVSFGYLSQDGMLEEFKSETGENFKYKRYNYRSNIDLQVTNSTKLAFTLGGQTQARNEPAYGSIPELWRMMYRYAVPWTSPGIVDGKYIQDNSEYIMEANDPLSTYYGLGYKNRVNTVLNFDLTLKQDLSKITKGLHFRVKTSYNTNSVQTKTRSAQPDVYTYYYARDYDTSLPEEDMSLVEHKIQRKTVPKYSEGYDKGRNWYFETALTYDRKFGDHEVGGLLLYNQRNKYYVGGGYNEIPRGYIGSAARVTYNYKTKYLLEGNIGYNGSENFHPDRRYGFFPAVSAGWVLSEESFIKTNASFIEYMKLRVSYGLVGNDLQGNNRFLYLPDNYVGGAHYNFGTDVPGNQWGYIESKLGNPYVSWETAVKQNYGMDLHLLKNRLHITTDYFFEDRKDILTTRNTTASIIGLDYKLLPAENIGKVHNEGFEISVRWSDKVNDLKYWISPNLTHNRNEVVYKDEIKQNEAYMQRTGQSVGQPFGYSYERLYASTDFNDDGSLIDGMAKPIAAVQPGDAKYQDLNNNGIIDTDDVKPIGYPSYPFTTVGINAGIKYKGFDFSMQWVGATHTSRVLAESLKSPFGETFSFSLLQHHVNESWTPETAATATQPRITSTNQKHNRNFNSELWTVDASYIRLKNAEIGYSFTGASLARIGAKSLRVYLNGYNLLTFDHMEGLVDPESNTSSRPTYPVMRIVNLGAKINF